MAKTKYEIHCVDEWLICKKALQIPRKGGTWLHYELSDHTIGLARPTEWRVKEKKP